MSNATELATNLAAIGGKKGPRIGRFIIEAFHEAPLSARHLDPVLRAIFRDFLPLKCEFCLSWQGMEFVGLHPDFEALDESVSILFSRDTIPEYGWTVSLTRDACGIHGLAMPHRLASRLDRLRILTGDPIAAASVRGAELVPTGPPAGPAGAAVRVMSRSQARRLEIQGAPAEPEPERTGYKYGGLL